MTIGTLVGLLIVLVVLGVAFKLVLKLEIAEPFRSLIILVVFIVAILWLLNFAGVANVPVFRR